MQLDVKLNQFLRFPEENVLIVMALEQESGGVLEKAGFSVFYTGLGLINASSCLTEAILKLKPDRIINLGTAGSFKHQQGVFFEVKSCLQRGDIVSLINSKIDIPTVTDLPHAICGSSDFIDNQIHSAYDIMDMEVKAYAQVAKKYQIPFHSFKFVTDSSNQNLMHDWKKNLQSACIKFLDFLHSLNQPL